VPLVIVGIVVLAVLLLSGLPFGRDDQATTTRPAVDTIAEGTAPPAAPPESGTVLELPGEEPIGTQTIAPPPLDTTGSINIGTPPATNTQPPPQQQPRVVEEPSRTTPAPRQTTPAPAPRQTTPVPAPRQTQPPPAPRDTTPAPAPRPDAQPSGEISDAEGSNTLRGFITSRTYYDGVSSNCVEIRSLGYRNVGYGYSVWDACVPGGGTRLLGRWRVDSKTREVFRQHDDGRFLRP
jgi:outer membrane biosynthesis protein TonB